MLFPPWSGRSTREPLPGSCVTGFPGVVRGRSTLPIGSCLTGTPGVVRGLSTFPPGSCLLGNPGVVRISSGRSDRLLGSFPTEDPGLVRGRSSLPSGSCLVGKPGVVRLWSGRPVDGRPMRPSGLSLGVDRESEGRELRGSVRTLDFESSVRDRDDEAPSRFLSLPFPDPLL